MSKSDTCPHCGHLWDAHKYWNEKSRCTTCGCLWPDPDKLPPPPAPPTEHELLVGKVRAAIYAELDAQHESETIDGAGYWDSEWGRLDGEPNWDAIAAAAITAIRHADAEIA